MKVMIDFFQGISAANATYKDGWHAHQWQRLKAMVPDVELDHYWKKLEAADIVYIDPGIDAILTNEFTYFGGFTPEQYHMMQLLKNKEVYWLGKNMNEAFNIVQRNFKSVNYHLRHILPAKLNVSPVNFKTFSFKLNQTIVGNVHCLGYATKQDKIILVNDTLEELLVDGLLYEDAIYCLGNGEHLDLELAEEYVKQVADMNGKICALLPFQNKEFSDAIVEYANEYLVEVIHTPKQWDIIPKMKWEVDYLDKDGYLKPWKYKLNGQCYEWGTNK